MSELLIEVRTGGLPPGALAGVTLRLKNSLVRALRERRLGPRQSSTSFTGRRLMILFRGLPEIELETERVVGPTVAEGLLDSGGATETLTKFLTEHEFEIEDLKTSMLEGQDHLVGERPIGPSRLELIGAAVAEGLRLLELPDPVRWGNGGGPWFRPIHGILALLDGETVPVEVFGVVAANTSVGHPTLSPRAFPVRDVAEYGQLLAELGIEARFADRRRILTERFQSLAQEVDGRSADGDSLLDQLAAGCEIPGAIRGEFDKSYLQLPRELIVTALRDLRQVVAVENEHSKELLPYFLASIDRPGDPRNRVRFGWEWTVGGLLSNLQVLHERDRRVPLAQRVNGDGTASSVAMRSRRLARIAASLAQDLVRPDGNAVNADVVSEAASLLEADRSTEIVRALPTLRGVYGGILARSEGYPESVWQAIYDCGQLRGDGLPESLPGRVVLLAEHLDTLVSLADLGELPEGAGVSKEAHPTSPGDSQKDLRTDRYGARPIARRVVRALASESVTLDLHRAATRAVAARSDLAARVGQITHQLWQLLDEALRAVLASDGYAENSVRAVLESGQGGREVASLQRRVAMVHSLRRSPGFDQLSRTASRLVSVLQESPEATIDVRLLTEEAEKDLFVMLSRLESQLNQAVDEGEAEIWIRRMLELNEGVDRFFAEILVRDGVESLRENRLALLQAVHRAYSGPVRLASLDESAG